MSRTISVAFFLCLLLAGTVNASLGIRTQAGQAVLTFQPQTLDDPIGCVYAGNRFLVRLSPENIRAGEVRVSLAEMGAKIPGGMEFPLYVFIEGFKGGQRVRADEGGRFSRRAGNLGFDYRGAASPDADLSQLITQRYQEVRDIRARIVARHEEWTADVNPVFMLSDNDRKQLLGAVVPQGGIGDLPVREPELNPVPDSMDWTNVNGWNYITGIRNQGNCGSCWAFATVAQVEALVNVAENDTLIDLNLSEQELVSCDLSNSGCNGGQPSTALSFVRSHGIPTEACFPYVGSNVACNPCAQWLAEARKISTVAVVTTTSQDEQAIKSALQYHPVSSCVYADNSFMAYSGGIFSYTGSRGTINHAILLVGWGGGTSQPYWKLKNSWGAGWGEQGFMRARRNQTNSLGCYTTDATYRPLYVDAGRDTVIHLSDTTSLNPTVRDGAPCYDTLRAAYTYAWSPRTGLSDSTLKNPRAFPTATTTYKLTVRDLNTTRRDSVRITVTTSNGPIILLAGDSLSPTPRPGATVAVVDTLANTGRSALNNARGTLRTPCPYAHLRDSTYTFGTIAPGAKANNGSSPFHFIVDNGTPQNTNAPFTLHLVGDTTGGQYLTDLQFAVSLNPYPDTNGTDFYIIGNGDNACGTTVFNTLLNLGYHGKFYNDNTFAGYPAIAPYRSVWVLVPGLGGTDTGYPLMQTGSADETQMVAYLNAGGRMYFQHPDLGYACDATGGHQLRNLYPMFHIGSYNDYSTNMAREAGNTGHFAEGMNFAYNPVDTGANNGNDIDALTPGTGAFTLFTSQTGGQNHVIAYDSGIYRTLASCLLFVGLTDSLAPSTQEVYADSIMHWFGIMEGVEQGLGIAKVLPRTYELGMARPNPVTRSAAISFALPRDGRISLKVYNLAGQLVTTLVDGVLPAGYHEARWDGRGLPSGVYFYHLDAGSFSAIRKLVLVR
jgi:cathepsin K